MFCKFCTTKDKCAILARLKDIISNHNMIKLSALHILCIRTNKTGKYKKQEHKKQEHKKQEHKKQEHIKQGEKNGQIRITQRISAHR